MTDIGQGLRLLLLILGKARYPREIARPTHGYAATREAAMTAFAKSWRRGIRRRPAIGEARWREIPGSAD